MGLFLLIRLLIALWSMGLIGAGLMVQDSNLASSFRGTWFGVNMIQIGAASLIGVLVWHYWAKAPAGSTFGQKMKFIASSLLSRPKRFWLLIKEIWAGAPVS